MASNVTDPTPTESPAISFALDALAQDAEGRVELTGRWYGVRGRRFVRPTLTCNPEVWWDRAPRAGRPRAQAVGGRGRRGMDRGLCARRVDQGCRRARAQCRPGHQRPVSNRTSPGSSAAGSARGRSSAGARSPRVRTDPPARPAIADRAQELERLRSRLQDLDAAHDRERSRREQAERHLEEERTEALRLRSEVGRLGAELDLARAAGDELAAASAELETIARPGPETGPELEAARAVRRSTPLVSSRTRARTPGTLAARWRTPAPRRRRMSAGCTRPATSSRRPSASATTSSSPSSRSRPRPARLRRELADAEASIRRLAGSPSGTVSQPRPAPVRRSRTTSRRGGQLTPTRSTARGRSLPSTGSSQCHRGCGR